MFDHVSHREEEEALLKWMTDTAPYYKELIVELEAHVDIVKKNGEVLKKAKNIRLKMIRDLKKELKEMKSFYIARKKENEHWITGRYQFRKGINNGRKHLYERESNDLHEGIHTT